MPKRLGRRGNRIRFAPGEPILTIRIALHHPSPGGEEELYELLAFESSDRPIQAPGPGRLREDISLYVRQELGEGFEVTRFTIGRGSVEILVAIAAAFEIIANWDDVVRNVGRLISRLRAYFLSRRVLPPLPGPVFVDADWHPDFDVGRVLFRGVWDSVEIPIPVALYVLAANLVMLGLLIWLVIARR